MHSKFSSDWLLSYIKDMQPVLETFKMAGYFPESPCVRLPACLLVVAAKRLSKTRANLKILKAQLNPICHLLTLLGAHHILHVSRIRVNYLWA